MSVFSMSRDDGINLDASPGVHGRESRRLRPLIGKQNAKDPECKRVGKRVQCHAKVGSNTPHFGALRLVAFPDDRDRKVIAEAADVFDKSDVRFVMARRDYNDVVGARAAQPLAGVVACVQHDDLVADAADGPGDGAAAFELAVDNENRPHEGRQCMFAAGSPWSPAIGPTKVLHINHIQRREGRRSRHRKGPVLFGYA